MKSHHLRHSGYLLIALGMIGLIFWQRGMMDDWMHQMRSDAVSTSVQYINNYTTTENPTTIISPVDIDVTDITTGETIIAREIIMIGKGDTTEIPSVDTTEIPSVDTTEIPSVDTTEITIAETPTTGGLMGDTVGGITSSNESPVSIIARKPGRTARQGKQFAYELANALDIGTGSILTTIDGYYDTQTLYDAWEQTQDTQMYYVLIDRLVGEHQYDDVITLLEEHMNLRVDTTPDTYIRALRESSQIDVTRPNTIQLIQVALDNMEQTQSLTSTQLTQQRLFVQMWNEGANMLVNKTDLIGDISLRSDMQKVLEYYTIQQNVPEYYRDTLVAMVLVQYGYFHLAEKIAIESLVQDPSYILPRQILAYSSFTKHNWSQAAIYLQELIDRDPDNRELYNFLRGVIAYWKDDYPTAVLLLRQTQDPRYLPDAVRYLALAYDHLNDEQQRDQALTGLLQYALEPSDYYTYFYLTLFQPFQEGRFQDQIVSLDTDTAKEYIRRCMASLVGDASIICEYGVAGILLAEGKMDEAHQSLLTLYQSYPYSYIAHALGDYYTTHNETQKAMRYYFLALRSTESPIEQDIAKQKIRELSTVEESE